MLFMSTGTPVRNGRWRSRQFVLRKTVKQTFENYRSREVSFFGHIVRNAELSQTSSLISQTLKLLPRIVVQRIGKKVLLSNNKEQFVSMSDRKTRYAISSLRFFAEKKWDNTKSLDDTIYLLNRLQKGVWQRTTYRKNWIQLKLLVFMTKISVFCKISIGSRKQQWKFMTKKMKRLTWKMV